MVVEKLINKLPRGLGLVKLILGGVLVGLLVSLGMVGVLKLLGFSVDPIIPSVFAGISAAIYAARLKNGVKNVCRKE